MYIEEINWLSKEIKEAKVTVSDGTYTVHCILASL